MRTTVRLDDDVLLAARQIAAAKDEPLGKVLSDLVRKSLTAQTVAPVYEHGIRLLPIQPGARSTSLEETIELRDTTE